MGIIKDFIQRARERRLKESEFKDNDRIINSIEEKKKSHNERVLAELLEEERQEYIKEALKWEERKRKLLEKKKANDMMHFNRDLFSGDWNA